LTYYLYSPQIKLVQVEGRRGAVTRYRSVVDSNTIKGTHCFLEQETLPSLLSTGWFHEQIQV